MEPAVESPAVLNQGKRNRSVTVKSARSGEPVEERYNTPVWPKDCFCDWQLTVARLDEMEPSNRSFKL